MDDFKVVINESLDTKLVDRCIEVMRDDIKNNDLTAIWELFYILIQNKPQRKAFLQYLPEEEWNNYI